MHAVTTGYGEYDKPQDFLDTFSSFVKNNQNRIAALAVVVQRPRELTRTELRSLRLELDKMGFSEPAYAVLGTTHRTKTSPPRSSVSSVRPQSATR